MAMTSPPTSFLEFLNDRRPEDEKILVALRYYLAELTDDRLPRELLSDVEERVGARANLQAALAELEGDRAAQLRVTLEFLAERWEDPAERERIVRAFGGAATKLPVIEAGLIAMVVMYGMFLLATKNRRWVKRRFRRLPDGTFEETAEEEMFGPTEPLKALLALVRGWAGEKEGAVEKAD
jgi:hypothetical protein